MSQRITITGPACSAELANFHGLNHSVAAIGKLEVEKPKSIRPLKILLVEDSIVNQRLDEYVAKPIRMEELCGKLNALFDTTK